MNRTTLLAFCVLALLAPRARATLYLVADPGAASLDSALTSAQAAASNDTVFFSPMLSSSLLTPGGTYAVNKPGKTLDLDANQATTINFTPSLAVNAGTLNINGLTTQGGITVNTGGTLSTSYSTIKGLTLNGGTFQTRDNSTTSGITLGASGGTIDAFGVDPAMNGLSGAGGLTVTDSVGGGILSLSGTNNYSGTTQINSGTLRLGAASALPLNGALNTAAGGTFDLNGFAQTLGAVSNLGTIKTGFAPLTVANYGGAGTLSVALKSGLTNLTVTGTATLTNGKLSVTGHPAPGAYTVVHAGTLTGQFASIALPGGVSDSFSYSGTDLLLNILSDTPFTATGQSANQAAIGAALNATIFGATGDLNSVINQLSAMSSAQVNEALDQIGPVSYAALTGMSSAASAVQSAAVAQRMTGLQAGRTSPDGARFASFSVQGASPYPGILVAELPGDTAAAYSVDKDRLYDPNLPWGFFVSALGSFDRLDSIDGSAGSQPGYSVRAAGATLGSDYRFNEHLAAGLSFGYVNSFARLDSDRGTVYGQSARLDAYGTVYNDQFHANLSIGGASDFYAASRNIPSLSRTATASPTGTEFDLDATAGYDDKETYATLSPFAGLAYDRLMLGSFSENGAGSLDLAVGAQTAESLRSTLGVKIARRFKPSWCDFTPYASVGWQHEFDSQSRALAASLIDGGSGTFTVNTADFAREAALLGAGADLDWTPAFSTRLAYAADLRADYAANTFSGSLRWRF